MNATTLIKRQARVLILDVDTAVASALCEVLVRQGHQVTTSATAAEGLQLVRETSFDVCLLDLAMPEFTGFELLTALKAASPDVEVIAMASGGTVDAAVQAVKAGAFDYLSKPFGDLDEASALVSMAAERKALRTAPQPEGSLAHLPYAEAKRLAMVAFERQYLSALLEKHGNNISSAARAAGVDRSNFRRLLKQYEVGGRSMNKPHAGAMGEGAVGPVRSIASA